MATRRKTSRKRRLFTPKNPTPIAPISLDDSRMSAILNYLQSNPPENYISIAVHLGLSAAETYSCLKQLESRGLATIDNPKEDTWTIPKLEVIQEEKGEVQTCHGASLPLYSLNLNTVEIEGIKKGDRYIHLSTPVTITGFRFCKNADRILPLGKPDDGCERFCDPADLKPIPQDETGQLEIFLGDKEENEPPEPWELLEKSEKALIIAIASLPKEWVSTVIDLMGNSVSDWDEYYIQQIVEGELCLECSTSLQELEGQVSQDTDSELPPLNLLKSIPMHSKSSTETSQVSPSTMISEPFTLNGGNTISSGTHSPAQGHPTLENEKDYHTPPLHCGEKESEYLLNANRDSVLLNNLQALSEEDFEQFLGDCEWQDTVSRLQQFEPLTWEQDTNENEFLLFPTLTSGDKGSARAVGQTKCDLWFKTNRLIPPGSQLSASAMALMMGFPPAWFEAISPSNPTLRSPAKTAPQDALEADTLQDEAVPPLKQPLSSGESSTWIPSPGDRVKLKNAQKPYKKGTTGTITFIPPQQKSIIHVCMDSDGEVQKIPVPDLIFLGDKQLSFLPLCPSCDQELIRYRDGCGVCGWSGIPVKVNDYTHPVQKGVVLKDLGNQFEIALDDNEVVTVPKLHVYPDFQSDEPSPSYPLEKSDEPSLSYPLEKLPKFNIRDRVLINTEQTEGIITKVNEGQVEPYYSVESGGEIWEYYESELSLIKRAGRKPASGTLYSYTASRRNKKGIEKHYKYWAYSYEEKDKKTGKWKTKKKSVSNGKRHRVAIAIAQHKPVEYILSILDGEC